MHETGYLFIPVRLGEAWAGELGWEEMHFEPIAGRTFLAPMRAAQRT